MKKILITGENSYVGNSFSNYMRKFNDYDITKISLKNVDINELDLSIYDVILHVAGIAHSDYGKISEEKSKIYYKVNTDLTINLAKKAKQDGVKQFIFMSSIIIYGNSAPIGENKIITKSTKPNPTNAYGDSKLKAEEGIKVLNDDNFKVAIIRAPMIYGDGCKGNFKTLEKIAVTFPLFPYIENERSAIHIDRLCDSIKGIIDNRESGIFFPQDAEYFNTCNIIKSIADKNNKKVIFVKGFTSILKLVGKLFPFINKAFGNLTYDKNFKYIGI